MKVLIRRNLWAVGMALVASLGSSAIARADLTLTITEDGNPGASFSGPIATGNPTDNSGLGITSASFTGTFGDFLISNGSAAESQNSFSGPLTAEAVQEALNIINMTGVTHVLRVTVTATKFTGPTAPPPVSIESSFGGTEHTGPSGTTGSASFQSTVASTTLPAQTFTPLPTGSFSNTIFGSTSLLTAPYSITQQFILTLNGGERLNFQGRTDVTPTPEPTTLASAGIAFVLLGGMGWLRRRK